MSEEAPEAPSEPKPRFTGPFKKRVAAEKPKVGKGWLSPWRIYSIGAIAAMGVTSFYLLKLTITPDMLHKAAQEEAPPAPPPPPGAVAAYCLPAAGGAPALVQGTPFCTEARPPACRSGDALQLTYTAKDSAAHFVYGAVVGEDKRTIEPMTRSQPARPGDEVPLGQWPVRTERTRTPAALLVLFSQSPIEAGDVQPWLNAWTRAQLLSRPPDLTPALNAKGAKLVAHLVCLGK